MAKKTIIRIYKTKGGESYATIDGVGAPFNQALQIVKDKNMKQIEKHESERQKVYIYTEV
jgi:hypothetical protein